MRVLVSLVLALASVLASGPVARADTGYWIPSSWVETSAGSGDARGFLGVGSVSVTAFEVSPGGDPLVVGPRSLPPFFLGGTNYHVVQVVGAGSYSGDAGPGPRLRTVFDECLAGSDGASFCGQSRSDLRVDNFWYYVRVTATYADGYTGLVDLSPKLVGGGACSVLSDLACAYEWAGAASGHGPIVRVTGDPLPASSISLDGFVWEADIALATTETELWCRDVGTGADTVVSESANGVTVPPAPVCPAGSFPVRVRVTNSVDGVVVDASITSSVLADYGAFFADPAAWSFALWEGGYPCIPGDASCIEALQGTWDEDLHECVLQGPGGQWVKVPDEVCQQAYDEAQPVIPSGAAAGDDPQPTSQDFGSVVRAIQRAASDIINGVGRALGEAMRGVESRLQEMGEAIRAVKTGLEALAEALAGGDGPGPAPGPGDLGINPGDLVAKFQPWIDALEDIWGAFGNSVSSDCQGPGWTLPSSLGGSRIYPFSACDPPMSTWAPVVRAVMTAGVGIGSLVACVRILSSAVGLQTNLKVGGE